MIEGLISGYMASMAESRQGKNGSVFVLAKVKATTDDGETLLVNVIAFAAEASATLLALGDGDAVSLAGAITPKVWTDKQGNTKPALDMVARSILSVR